jgi:hypothetical protein
MAGCNVDKEVNNRESNKSCEIIEISFLKELLETNQS